MCGYTQRVWKQQKGFLGRRVNSTHLICIIMAVRRVLCYSSIFYLLMCLLSLHLSGKSFNSASKGIGYDLTTLIVTRDVSTPRIESIFLHPKKSAKASVMASHSKLVETLSKHWRRRGGRQPEVKFPALELINIITWSVACVFQQWRRRER